MAALGGMGAAGWISAAGTALSVANTIAQGKQADTNARFQAAQMNARAAEERATSQREAAEERRRSKYLESRVRAVAAASGAGADDPTIENIVGGIDAEGEYRALSQLYSGESAAEGLDLGAQVQRIEGRNARESSYYQAGSTLMDQGSSLYRKYGNK